MALDPDTGEYIWHYQTVPGETWDFNSNMDIVLADLTIDGRERQVILHAPKNGFFYVIDRTNGKVISAEQFVATTWASHIDLATGRPVENPLARYADGRELVTPGPAGGHNWHAMSFNPQTGLAYYPATHNVYGFNDEGHRSRNVAQSELALRLWALRTKSSVHLARMVSSVRFRPGTRCVSGWHGRFRCRDRAPIPGTMTTAGNLVFQGRAGWRVCGLPRG